MRLEIDIPIISSSAPGPTQITDSTQGDEQDNREKPVPAVQITAARLLMACALIGGFTCVAAIVNTVALKQRSLFPLVTISVFAKYHPAVYIFRVGLVSCGVLSWQAGILLRRRTQFWGLGLAMGVGMAGLSVVSPAENNPLHLVFAGSFFGSAAAFETGMAVEASRACQVRRLLPLFRKDVNPRHQLRWFAAGAVFAWCCILLVVIEFVGAFGKHKESNTAVIEISGVFHLLAFTFWLGRVIDA
mmetsp:Transcript_89788/g.232781  ORF Transcript_89788/g.232781 Transcript_89788/m.232781 type:complete len:245 (-) Transcript_89788:25-759(-)